MIEMLMNRDRIIAAYNIETVGSHLSGALIR